MWTTMVLLKPFHVTNRQLFLSMDQRLPCYLLIISRSGLQFCNVVTFVQNLCAEAQTRSSDSLLCFHSDPTEAPSNVSVAGVTATSLDLRWSALPVSARKGQIAHYQVRYGPTADETGRASVNAAGMARVVDALAPDREYVLQVRACTAVGCSPWGKPVTARTLARK